MIFIYLTSCGTKYNYNFDRGKAIDFSKGKWILNQNFTNLDSKAHVQSVTKDCFLEVIVDSLLYDSFCLNLENKLKTKDFPLHPSKKDLAHIREFTECDFLINVSTLKLKNNAGSFTFSRDYGTSIKKNESVTKIWIYDLNTLELISKSQSTATNEVKETEDSGFGIVTSSYGLAFSSLRRLIKKYDKYRKDK